MFPTVQGSEGAVNASKTFGWRSFSEEGANSSAVAGLLCPWTPEPATRRSAPATLGARVPGWKWAPPTADLSPCRYQCLAEDERMLDIA